MVTKCGKFITVKIYVCIATAVLLSNAHNVLLNSSLLMNTFDKRFIFALCILILPILHFSRPYSRLEYQNPFY